MTNSETLFPEEIQSALEKIGEKALKASRLLACADPETKNRCLNAMADGLMNAQDPLMAANAIDMRNAEQSGLSAAMQDRLHLDASRIAGMAEGLRTVASQHDPVGRILSETVRPNGLKIVKISVPLGVIGIIYESRPNVTSDAAGICIKAGNAVILRGGSEAIHSNLAIADVLNAAAVRSGMPDGIVQVLPWTEHAVVTRMLKMDRYINLIIPRGGERLIRAVMAESLIPVIKHYKGVCHTFIDRTCDPDMALKIVENAKCQRPSACNALETLLVDREIAPRFMPMFVARMHEKHVEVRGDAAALAFDETMKEASPDDYGREYLDYILAVRIVDGVAEAVDHINFYGSKHSDAIVSDDSEHVRYFFANVDSATVYHNASTRFTDGGEFGMGAEIGISTDKLHARGPMGADELTTYKFLIEGSGQVRA